MLKRRTLVQGGLNAASAGLVSLLSAVFTALAARNLTTTQFGSVQFAISLLQFVALFFEFGLSIPAARVAARAGAAAQRGVVGATLTAYAPVGIAFSLLMFGLSFTIDQWSQVHASAGLRATALIAFAYPFQLISLQLSQGLDRLHVASITNVLGQAVSVLALALIVTSGHLTVEVALLLRAMGLLVGSLILIFWLRPRFDRIRAQLKLIVSEVREYGFAIYIGRIFSVATYNMDVLMLGILSSARAVSLYTLAGALARVILLPTAGATSALFPRMVRDSRISAVWTRLSVVAGLSGLVGLLLVGPYLIGLVFSSRYNGAAAFLLPLGAAEAVRGVTLVYNTFLSAHARGRDLRNTGIVLTGSNLVLNFSLIPPFGAAGAAWASLMALIANLAAHVIFYRRSVCR